MVYKYVAKRSKSIEISEVLHENLALSIKNNINKEKQKLTKNRLNFCRVITHRQYKDFFNEPPYITPKIKVYELKEKVGYVRNGYENILKNTFILSTKKVNSMKLLHDIHNMDNIIYICERFKHITKNRIILPDNAFTYTIEDNKFYKYTKKHLRPDSIIISDDGSTIFFIETDMGKEEYKTLKTKDLNYEIFIRDLIKQGLFSNYKVFFFSSQKRIDNIIQKDVFHRLSLGWLIEFVSQN